MYVYIPNARREFRTAKKSRGSAGHTGQCGGCFVSGKITPCPPQHRPPPPPPPPLPLPHNPFPLPPEALSPLPPPVGILLSSGMADQPITNENGGRRTAGGGDWGGVTGGGEVKRSGRGGGRLRQMEITEVWFNSRQKIPHHFIYLIRKYPTKTRKYLDNHIRL